MPVTTQVLTPSPDKRGQTAHTAALRTRWKYDARERNAQDTDMRTRTLLTHWHWLTRSPHVRTCPRRPHLPGALPTLPRLAPSRAELSSSRPPTHRSTRTRPRASMHLMRGAIRCTQIQSRRNQGACTRIRPRACMHHGRSTGLDTWWRNQGAIKAQSRRNQGAIKAHAPWAEHRFGHVVASQKAPARPASQ